MIGIYKITSPSDKIYIGQSWNINSRWKKHKYSIPKNSKLGASFKKHGIDNHIFEVIHELPKDVEQEVINNYERLYVELYKDCGIILLNLREAGSNGKFTAESIEKMRNSHLGKKLPEAQKQKIIKALTGRPCSAKTREKLRETTKVFGFQKGVSPSKERIEKQMNTRLKNGKIRKKLSDEARKKMSDDRKGIPNLKNRGRVQTREAIEKRRAKKLGSKASDETKRKQSLAAKGKPWTQKRRDAYLNKYFKNAIS